MNIFYLDTNPATAATYHNDKHVIKMILESAQLLCTALNVTAGKQITPYKTTHINHPCSIWVRESFANWYYVYQLMLYLENEWQFRYGHVKKHKSVSLLVENQVEQLAKMYLSGRALTTPALAMPEHCKILNDPVLSYREYYRKEKGHINIYTRREKPIWLKE